ncbi:MAG TPA: metallophosphoesterase [Thermoanaerobaculia bacterium]|nr:metallophosphoesterase [Thermoanaerobaculia bacterium]
MPPLLLLHLSDLHFGPHSRFVSESPERLGESFHRALVAAQDKIGLADHRIELVLVTGDVAEAGKRSEFENARRFLAALAGGLGLVAGRFVFVPGNHDINWASCKRVEAELEEREELAPELLRRRLDEVKLDIYFEFLRSFYGVADLAEVAAPLGRGANLFRFPQLRLAVAALNSCEKESHRPADHAGLVSREQAEAALSALRGAEVAAWLKLLAVHHNPVVTTPGNLAAWRRFLEVKGGFDAELLARYESDALGFDGRGLRAVAADARVQLVLHGHHHAQDKQTWDWSGPGHTHVLSAGSLGLQPEVLPKDEPASARLIVLDIERQEIRAHSVVYIAWHRPAGAVEWGAFAPDPAGWMVQRLDLPEGYATAATAAAHAPPPALDTDFLRTFRQRLRDTYSRWDIGSLGALRPGGVQAGDAPLDDMYLELRFTSWLDPINTFDNRPLRPDDLLGRNRPLVLRGAGGSGKTTWARFTFSQLALDDRALPLMLVLRDVARRWQLPESAGEERSIDAALDAWIGSQMGIGWRGRLASLLKAGDGPRPILLVDGWDELGPLGSELRGKLLGFIREHPRVLAVVTSRPYGQDPPSHSEGFEVVDLQPLSDSDIKQLTRKFFRRFASGGEASVGDECWRFLEALEHNRDAQDLARTPLLLTMLLLVGHSQPLPDKRHLLYEKCVDALLHARPEQKTAEGALAGSHLWTPPDLDRRRRWVATLAYNVQSAGYRETSRGPIVRSWEEMRTLLPEECARDRRDGFLAWLVETAGLLSDRADGTLAFSHLSFQEYLAAYHLETTAADAGERRAAFGQRIPDFQWWETLRLLGAQIETRNPAFLDAVLDGLVQAPASEYALAFAGTVFADGLGPVLLFQEWLSLWLKALARAFPPGVGYCWGAWRSSRQEKRKGLLREALSTQASGQTWLGWVRFEEFDPASYTVLSRPTGRLARLLIDGLKDGPLTQEGIAAGRVLAGFEPLWPTWEEVGHLQAWPSRRRRFGLQLQAFLAAGVPTSSLVKLARAIAPQALDAASRGLARDLARNLAHELALDLAPHSGADKVGEAIGYLACDWASHLASHFTSDLETRQLPFHWPPRFGQIWVFSQLFPGFASFMARNLVREDPDKPSFLWAGAWARGLASKLALDPIPDFTLSWVLSSGFAAGRAFLAAQRDFSHPETLSALSRLLSAACCLSFRPESQSELPVSVGPHLDCLWPALARHLARRSTAQDRELLVDLARDPAKREPPLQWGLRFIVRGDLLLDDGSFLALDELTDQAGIERLPLLDEMEPELDVAWENGS